MKQIYFFMVIALSFTFNAAAQVEVTIDNEATYVGFANVFETDANGGGFVFNSGWAVEDIKSTIGTSENTVTLQPNFNTYADNPTDPFWVDQSTMEGNKTFEGNTFIENADLAGEEITFVGNVSSNTLSSEYEAIAFIKVFNADFSVVKSVTAPLVEGEDFVLNYTEVEAADAVVQYGFTVTGINANPADEDALGNIVVGPSTLSIADESLVMVNAFPNPSTNGWNIQTANQNITNVTLYDMAGKQVAVYTPETTAVKIAGDNLSAGIYIASVTTTEGSSTIKLIKK